MFDISDQTNVFGASLNAFWLNGTAESSRCAIYFPYSVLFICAEQHFYI